jgi:hypothetical protein
MKHAHRRIGESAIADLLQMRTNAAVRLPGAALLARPKKEPGHV